MTDQQDERREPDPNGADAGDFVARSQADEWVREQLGALPSPRMPQHVRAQLDAAIAAEGARRHVDTADDSQARGGIGALPAQRRRPIMLSLLGVAAAFTLFAAVDPFGQSPGVPDEIALQAPQAGESAATGIGAALVASGTAYTQDDLFEQVSEVLAAAPADSSTGALGPEAGTDQEITANGRAATDIVACLSAVPGDPVLVDQATFESRPAIVTVTRGENDLTVTVQATSCTATDPAVIYRDTVGIPPPTP